MCGPSCMSKIWCQAFQFEFEFSQATPLRSSSVILNSGGSSTRIFGSYRNEQQKEPKNFEWNRWFYKGVNLEFDKELTKLARIGNWPELAKGNQAIKERNKKPLGTKAPGGIKLIR